MCGRFLNALPSAEIARIFSVNSPYLDTRPTYNAAPTQSLPVVRFNAETRERQIDLLRWGLVPLWAKDLSIGAKCINARAETVASKPMFRDAYAKRRCIVPAGGFYEWKKLAEGKQPYAIVPKDGTLFAFAGLWERWKNPETEEVVRTFAIVTGKPNSVAAEIHDRMPVTLDREDWAKWLGEEEASADDLKRILEEPYPAQLMHSFPVSTRVNSVRNK